MKNIVILGPQGSGKGTQAELLAERFGYLVIGAGESLREIAKKGSDLGKLVHQTINVEGRLVEPELIASVIEEKLKTVPSDEPVLIDGFPRTVRQYELMKKFWPSLGRGDYVMLYIELSENEAVKRLAKRYVCSACGENHIGDVGSCRKCDGQLIQRDDDKPEAVRTRLRLFNRETLPMVNQMEKEVKVIRIDGAPSVEEVHREIIIKLNLQ